MTEFEIIEEIEQPKYIVFKMEDWHEFGGAEFMGAQPVDDAVVIRRKDPFAATALYTYCNTIMSFLELLEDHISETEHQRLLDIADYFHQQAMDSEKIKGKRLPT